MRTLIAYTTRYGTAEQAAHRLKAELQGEVDVINLNQEQPGSLASYDQVILGGSIYFGRIQKELMTYASTHTEALLNKRLGLFICAGETDPVNREKELREAFPRALYDHARCKSILGYQFQMDKLKWFERWMVRMVKGIRESCSKISENDVKDLAGHMRDTWY
ncbi:flavodoxin domain-containing protein [Marinicrinis sediminis]|uniref:Flavodoxin domain-containing protein n=1 Tax=Marinicrinis sediminis TaxID=1652465 RepID=A0ABW5RFR6_9BACL